MREPGFPAQHPGYCATCKRAYPKGTRVVWVGHGSTRQLAEVACHEREHE